MRLRPWVFGAAALIAAGVLSAFLLKGAGAAGASALAASADGWLAARTYCERRGTASRRDDHGHTPADNISGQRYKSISLTIRGAEINLHVPAFDVTGVF